MYHVYYGSLPCCIYKKGNCMALSKEPRNCLYIIMCIYCNIIPPANPA